MEITEITTEQLAEIETKVNKLEKAGSSEDAAMIGAVLKGIIRSIDEIEDILKKRLFKSDEELDIISGKLKSIDKKLSELLVKIPSVPRSDFASQMEKDFRELINSIFHESVRINELEARIKNALKRKIPISNNLDCTYAYIMRDAFQKLGYYAEVADYEAPGYSRYGNYNPAPIVLTNAGSRDVLTLFPDFDDFYYTENGEDEYYDKYNPVGFIYEDYSDSFEWPSPLVTAKDKLSEVKYYFSDHGGCSNDDWILVKTEQMPQYSSDKVICFSSKGDYSEFSNAYLAKLSEKTYRCISSDGKSELVDEKIFASAEHYYQIMMAEEFDPDGKALKQMGNHLTYQQIKSLGSDVKNIKTKAWKMRRRFHMRDALEMKFWQNQELKELLLSTGDAVLAYADPRDTFWGIGYSVRNPKAEVPSRWRGRNVLGNMLMCIRGDIRRYREKEREKQQES